jgi:DNA-binding response OmpR family regulator
MVLDDDATARQILRRYLELYGYDTVEAGTVDDAVASLKREHVHAVILDVGLAEERTGLDVLRALRRLPGLEKLPAIILTGKVLDDAEERSIVRERAYLFQKPENLDVLIQFLDQVLTRAHPQSDRKAIG